MVVLEAGTPPEEIEEWGRRMIESPEEAEYLATEGEWRAFIAGKIRGARGYAPTKTQIKQLAMERERFMSETGVRVERRAPPIYPTIVYRDVQTGRFVSRVNASQRFTEFFGLKERRKG